MKAAGSACSPAARQMVVIWARSSALPPEARRGDRPADRLGGAGAGLQRFGARLQVERFAVDLDLGPGQQGRRQKDDHVSSPREKLPWA